MAIAEITKAKLKASAKAQAKASDSSAQNITQAVERLYSNFIIQFQKKLAESGKMSASLEMADAVRIMTDLDSILVNSGLQEVGERFRDEFLQIADATMESYAILGQPKSLAGLDATALDLLVAKYTNDFVLNVSEQILPTMRNILVSGVGGQLTWSDAISQVSAVAGDLRIDQIETLVSDTYTVFGRQLKDEQAKKLGLEIAIVVGPDDDVTRPLCDEVLNDAPHGVPGMYYVDELAEIDNEQNGNYLIYGGGYNCRHSIERVDLETAKSWGFEE